MIENNLAIGKNSDLNNNIDILYRRVETHVNNAKIKWDIWYRPKL